jgi:hypothetical protein
LSPPVVDSPLPSTHSTRHHLFPARSMLVQISSTLPTSDCGLQHVLAPPLGRQARGRKPNIATRPLRHSSAVSSWKESKKPKWKESMSQAHRSSSPSARSRAHVHVPVQLHVGSYSSLNWLRPSMAILVLTEASSPAAAIWATRHHRTRRRQRYSHFGPYCQCHQMLLQGASQRGALTSKGGLGIGVIAASHMITKSAHARTTSVASSVAALVIGGGIIAFGLPLLPIELTPPCNVIILNNRGLGLS